MNKFHKILLASLIAGSFGSIAAPALADTIVVRDRPAGAARRARPGAAPRLCLVAGALGIPSQPLRVDARQLAARTPRLCL
jgi:hypothetical protein